MLEKKDLEMIAEVVSGIVKPLDSRLDSMDSRLDSMDSRLDSMDSRLDNMDSRLDNMDSRLDNVESKVTEIQMTLENETNKEIMIIAEGHLDLSRKLDDALRVETEKEMLLLRVSRLESDVRKLKQRINETA